MMLQEKAYLHHFQKYGVEEEDLQQAMAVSEE